VLNAKLKEYMLKKKMMDNISSVSDIVTFFTTSSRNKNDASNKIRENILKIITSPPKEYLEDVEYGNSWRLVQKEWHRALVKLAEDTSVPSYTIFQTTSIKGGRKSHYDVEIGYYNDSTLVAKRKIEFKNGGTKIDGLPQFLSLPVKFGLFPTTCEYDKFFYENYLDTYLACDTGLTAESKPLAFQYIKQVSKTKYTTSPFFSQLKDRELIFQDQKNHIVNTSITDYLTQYGSSISLEIFKDKIETSQTDKHYLLWSQDKFHYDKIYSNEMTNMTFQGIKNGNVLEIKADNAIYSLLLRWRNHKGILNPAWQISMKRTSND